MDKDKRKHVERLCVPEKWKFGMQCIKLPSAEFVLSKLDVAILKQRINQNLPSTLWKKIIDRVVLFSKHNHVLIVRNYPSSQEIVKILFYSKST